MLRINLQKYNSTYKNVALRHKNQLLTTNKRESPIKVEPEKRFSHTGLFSSDGFLSFCPLAPDASRAVQKKSATPAAAPGGRVT